MAEARRYMQFPPEAADARFKSPYAVFPWEIETLLSELLIVPKRPLRDGPNKVLNCRKFGAIVKIINALRDLENAESGIYLRRMNILDELHRIAQREFPWQSGYFNRIQFYRYSYIYGGQDCATFFEQQYGVSPNAVSLFGFGMHGHFLRRPAFRGRIDLAVFGLTDANARAALKLIGAPLPTIRTTFKAELDQVSRKWGQAPPIAYRPSVFRRYPLVEFPDGLVRSPLPELILQRVTSGLYYDLLPGGGSLRNEASRRFERYSGELLGALISSVDVTYEYQYRHLGRGYRSPDVLGSARGLLQLIIECKATKLSLDAQYAEDPIKLAQAGYDELAKGAYQIWRHVAHVRGGSTRHTLHPNAFGVVLTLDNWMMMSRELRKAVLRKAEALCEAVDDIQREDKIPVVFCSIKDFENVLLQADHEGLIAALAAAAAENYAGWQLPDVHKDIGRPNLEKSYPFDMGDVLPWVRLVEEEARRRKAD
ncbi:hypothetical protein [Vitreimonas sp.]|uniref:hypothetical protein n=1 Tax=Vitreimonas sp. TaxID=3069702 RepID=UPI002D783F41|nr:hypothetical protein [Vitreimonas sp.]